MCYDDEPISWHFAENFCIDYYNGHLASFFNESYIESFIALTTSLSITDNDIWFGLYDNQDNETWQYTDGVELLFTNWKVGAPGSSSTNSRCG